MNHGEAYGLWSLVAINAAVFILFAFSFAKPQTSRDWRSFGAFSAFLVALFAEMYGFPLTIYLLSGWLGRRFPQLDLFSHESGHLWHTLFGWQGDPHLDPFHRQDAGTAPCQRRIARMPDLDRAARLQLPFDLEQGR